MKDLQKRQTHYYERNAHDLPILDEGETVRMTPFTLNKKEWKKAVVIRRLDERSYTVETADGASYGRNRANLRMTKEPPPNTNINNTPGVVKESSRQHKNRSMTNPNESTNVSSAKGVLPQEKYQVAMGEIPPH